MKDIENNTIELIEYPNGNYEKDEIDTLLQAANLVIFKPTADSIPFFSKILAPQEPRKWIVVLEKLKRDEAIIKGCFQLEGRNKHFFATLLVKI